MTKKMFSIEVGDAVRDRRQFPKWVNRPGRSPDTHAYWRDTPPPGPYPQPNNETYGVGSGFPIGMEEPLLIFEKPMGLLPFVDVLLLRRELWLISQSAKDALFLLDPEAFEFRQAKTLLHDQSDGPPYWICDVVRFLDPIDEILSGVTISAHASLLTGLPFRSADYNRSSSLVFKASEVNNHHLFRPILSPATIFCDELVATVIQGAKLTGVQVLARGYVDDKL